MNKSRFRTTQRDIKQVPFATLIFATLFITVLISLVFTQGSFALAADLNQQTESGKAKLYLARARELQGIKTSNLALYGPNQVTAFGDAFSPTTSRYRAERGHNGTYTFSIEVPVDYQGTVLDNASGSLIHTNILRVELLDPDSINRLIPADSLLSHSEKFVVEVLKNGATSWVPIELISEDDCPYGGGNQLHLPCVIETCEWSESTDQGRCQEEPYADYYNQNTNPYSVDQINPLWIMRLDELRRPWGNSTDPQHQTATIYTLYYFKQNENGVNERVDLASYTGQTEHDPTMLAWGGTPIGEYHVETDLHWVSPGAWNALGPIPTRCGDQNWVGNNGGFDIEDGGEDGCTVATVGDEDDLPSGFGDLETMGRGFEINMAEDVEGIIVDEARQIQTIFLDVKTVAGASENGFDIWAGPPHAHYGLKSELNQRNLQLTDSGRYWSEGVTVYALGVLPLNSLTNNRTELPIAYIPAELAGQTIELSIFDSDSGTSYPLCFYFDTLPAPDCASGFDDSVEGYMVYYDEENDNLSNGIVVGERCFPNCNDLFVSPPFLIQVPGLTEDCDPTAPFDDRMLTCNAFTGGRLMVSYDGGSHDTYQWLVDLPQATPPATPTSTSTVVPTDIPTNTPTPIPTDVPTSTPTIMPTDIPAIDPIATPSVLDFFIFMPTVK